MPTVPQITLKEEQEEKERLQQLALEKKQLNKFNRKLGKKQFFEADILFCKQSQSYHDKVSQCFKMRVKQLQRKKLRETDKWSKVVDENQNYCLNKRGYKELLGDIGDSNRRITKVKRGLSVFSDSNLRS